MTSRLRQTWQARFGDAGRGLVARGQGRRRSTTTSATFATARSGDWHATVGGARGDTEPFGIDGHARLPASARARSCGSRPARSVGAGNERRRSSRSCTTRRRITASCATASTTSRGSSSRRRPRAIEPPHPARQVIAVADGPHKLTLEHGGGGVLDLFGVVMERAKPGVIVDSLGVVGRRLGSLRSWDWSIIGEQLATRDPRLVVLQYGTNEADDPDLDPRGSRALLRRDDPADPRGGADRVDPDPRAARHGRARGRQGVRPHEAEAGSAGVIPECEWRTPAMLARDHLGRARGGGAQPRRVLRHVRGDGRRRPHGRVGRRPSRRSRTRIAFTSPTSATSAGPMRCRARCSRTTRSGGTRRTCRPCKPIDRAAVVAPPRQRRAAAAGPGRAVAADAVLEPGLPAVPDRGVLPLRAVAAGRRARPVGADRADGPARRSGVPAGREGSRSAVGSARRRAVPARRQRLQRRDAAVADRDAGAALGRRRSRCSAARSRSACAPAAGSRRSAASASSRAASSRSSLAIGATVADRVARRPRSTRSPPRSRAHGHLLVLAILGVGIGAAQVDATPHARPRRSCCSSRRACSIRRGRSRCRGRIATSSRCCSARSSSITTSAIWIERAEAPLARKALVIVSLCSNLGILFFFKYAILHAGRAAPAVRTLHLILPAGISFHTFQSLSYTIDVYRKQLRATRSPIQFATFVLFFPQLVAGPIVRAQDLLPQLADAAGARAREGDARAVSGSSSACSRRSRSPTRSRSSIVDRVFETPGALLVARGARRRLRLRAADLSRLLARTPTSRSARPQVLGFDLPENFRTPYRSANLQEFWRRWHISLSTWLRDYLYITLGGSRGAPWRTYLNLIADDAARRPVARRELDVRRVGRAARLRARGHAVLPAPRRARTRARRAR